PAFVPSSLHDALPIYVVARLDRALDAIRAVQPLAKMNGATGNYNAHLAAYPEVDWPAFSGKVLGGLGLVQNPYSIQIEPHDWMADRKSTRLNSSHVKI